MSYFLKKNEQTCHAEIRAASEYVSQTFNAPINLHRLQAQVEKLIETKIDDYYHQRFKDWTVADLLLLAQTIGTQIEEDGPKADKRSRKTKVASET